MKRAYVVVVTMSLAVGAPARAQQITVDEATFDHYRGSTLVGRERITLSTSQDRSGAVGYTISFRATFPPDRPGVTLAGYAEFGPDSLMTGAQLGAQGDEEFRTFVSVGARRVTVRLVSPTGETTREYPSGGFVRLVESRTVSTFAIRLPGAASAIDLIEADGTRTAGASARRVTDRDGLVTVTLGSGPAQRTLVYDPAGRLLRVDFPALELSARRVTPSPE